MATINTQVSRTGQACDRCRNKKIKCDGAIPSCASCITACVQCEVSATLRRKAKIRGFGSDRDDALVQALQAENADLRKKLEAECQTSQSLREELDRVSQQASTRPRKLHRPMHPATSQQATSPSHPTSSDAGASQPERSIHVVKHMGRMVHDGMGVGRFAGSTTGVHFVLRVEDACVQALGYTSHFPESSFRLHLLPIHKLTCKASTRGLQDTASINQAEPSDTRQFRQNFTHPLDYYIHQIDSFIERWECFCPVLVRKDIVQDVANFLHPNQGLSFAPGGESNLSAMIALAMILSINQLGHPHPDHDQQRLVTLAHGKLHDVVARGDLKALQALILCAFHAQLTGQSLQLLQLNALMVRTAQSIGLHRHDRRFKFKSAMIEHRRRIWWWIYAFDKITSVTNGLPELVKEADIDNDMPVDCNLDDLNAEFLSHPLPGETTPVFLFNQYVLLCKKLSAILSQLYTTTQRRGGAEKITRLDRDLRVWNHSFNALPHVAPFELAEVSPHAYEEDGNEGLSLMNHWIQLLANIAMVQIHRPALTFDLNTPEFINGLKTCVKSSSAILNLLENTTSGWWLRSICPSSPALVFQSALMHIYFHCNPSMIIAVGSGSRSTSISTIAKAVQLLRCYLPEDPDIQDAGCSEFCQQPIVQAMETLTSLQHTLSHDFVPQMEMAPQEGLAPPDQPLANVPTGLQNGALDHVEAWNSNALEYLNNFDTIDWMWPGAEQFPTVP
ncbi:hypothetical protein B0A52_08353 [Exophiala mesophila]|uniref:Zn(2)-C6 fungal-type domain-containing protein n=1 Tax=Exophiala mesophila TaxID=212818 RepID=A0A438MTT3_EXOME|nr:hypothetical protein B0A52_08353 [Exophiala mesophila]